MKPAISYGLVRSVYRAGWQIIAITSTVGRRVYGRDQFGNPTNRATRDLIAQFPTEADCQNALARIQASDEIHAPIIKAVEKAVRDALLAARDEARLTACRSHPVAGLEPAPTAAVA